MAGSAYGFAAPLYYGSPAEVEAGEVGGIVSIGGAEAHHAARVRRVRVGEHISIGDGFGRVVTGQVTVSRPDEVAVVVEAVVTVDVRSPELVLVQALAKGDRDELAIQGATEVGVDRIVPWAAARSVSRWNAGKREAGRQRWETIVREASKQALRARRPGVDELADLAGVAACAQALIVLDPAATDAFADVVADSSAASSIAIIVGPEGGIDATERERLTDAGARVAVLGDTVLRTSTAGPVALSIAQTVLGRWRSRAM